jgi:hypothetical protein
LRQEPQEVVALFFGHFGQPLGPLVELLQIPTVDLEQLLEAGDQVVVSGHGVELRVVELS